MAPPLPALYSQLLEGQLAMSATKELQQKGGQTEKMQQEEVEVFKINQINDFTTEVVRQERSAVEESGALPILGICPTRHGGPLDYPKLAAASVATVCDRWEACFAQIQPRRKKIIAGEAEEGQNTKEEAAEEDFFASVSESVAKLLLHLAWLTETGVHLGDVERLVGVGGGLALIRNKLWHYNEVVLTKEGGRRFTDLYQEASQLADAVCEQVRLYHLTSLATVVLQDSASQDWENPRAWHEGERLSCCVQLWWFSVQGARHSLYSSLPPTSASAILSRLINDSLSLFVHRYSNLKPTSARLAQYRCDLVAILLGVAHLLPSISSSLDSPSNPASQTKLSAIHTKADALLAALVMVGAPASALAAELVPASSHLPAMKVGSVEKESWISLLCPSISPGRDQPMTKSEKSQRVSKLVKLVAGQPQPAWGLQVQACLSSSALLPTSLLTQMGAFVPPNPAACDTTQATCGMSSCSGRCLGPAGPLWPVQVVHGALLPLAQPSSQVHLLARSFQPLLTRLSAHSWDCLQASSLWNLRRPVWLAALVRLLEPWLAPAVVDLLRSVEEGSTWTLSHLEKARKLLVTELAHLLQVLPPSLCHLLLRIDSQLPQNVNSLGGSACSHIIFATIYTSISNLLPELRKARVAREKIDFLIAFCENLCNLDIVADIGWVNQCLTSILQGMGINPAEKEETGENEAENEIEVGEERSELIAFDILQQQEAKIPLQALNRFLVYNVDWVDWAIGVHIGNGPLPKLRPWDSRPSPSLRPVLAMQKVGEVDLGSLLQFPLDWPRLVRAVLANPCPSLAKLLLNRPAYLLDEQLHMDAEEVEEALKLQECLGKKLDLT